MRSIVRRRFWIELRLAAIFLVGAILTASIPDWIEVFFGIEPDEGGGGFEVGVTVALVLAAIALAVAARLEFRAASSVRLRLTDASPADR